MDIPIIIICYNNYKYVKNTLTQILKINKEYYKNIQILNNNSTCVNTIEFLSTVDVKVIHNSSNTGPWINESNNVDIYNSLPDKFILTDPDLKLNENIPRNFIEILSELSDKYKKNKTGFALDISDSEKMYQDTNYYQSKSIYQWELPFWGIQLKVKDDTYEIYETRIDTTFSLVNKKYHMSNHIRIAGNFTAKHLPWYIQNEIYTTYENYINNMNTSRISTMSSVIISYINSTYIKIYKNNELFLIENNEQNENLSFWKNVYSRWDNDTFQVLDTYLSTDKIFIDIGGWIGTTAMYASRKSKYVYSIEADTKSFNEMTIQLKTNCCKNYTLINKGIFNMDDINNYQINPSEISLIKVDIKGEEENILSELFDIHNKYQIPLYIRFHYTLWKDTNLDRFDFLSFNIKNKIRENPITVECLI